MLACTGTDGAASTDIGTAVKRLATGCSPGRGRPPGCIYLTSSRGEARHRNEPSPAMSTNASTKAIPPMVRRRVGKEQDAGHVLELTLMHAGAMLMKFGGERRRLGSEAVDLLLPPRGELAAAANKPTKFEGLAMGLGPRRTAGGGARRRSWPRPTRTYGDHSRITPSALRSAKLPSQVLLRDLAYDSPRHRNACWRSGGALRPRRMPAERTGTEWCGNLWLRKGEMNSVKCTCCTTPIEFVWSQLGAPAERADTAANRRWEQLGLRTRAMGGSRRRPRLRRPARLPGIPRSAVA